MTDDRGRSARLQDLSWSGWTRVWGVVEENMLKESIYMSFVMDDTPTHKLFLPQYDLVKYNHEDTMTSDLYKDKQRQEVYSLLDL